MKDTNKTNLNLPFLFTGKFVSELGNGIYFIALSWFVLSRVNGIAEFGLLMVINALPALLVAPIGGIIIDRYHKKYVLVFCDITQSLIFSLLVFFYFFNGVSFGILAIVCVLNGIIKTIYEPAVKATLPLLVPETELQKINSMNAAIGSFTNLLGMFMGGLIVAFFGVIGCFIFNSASFLFSAVCESLIRMKKQQLLKTFYNLKSLIQDIRIGFNNSFSTRDLSLVFVFSLILTLFVMPSGYLLFPIVLKNIFKFKESLFGIIQAGFPAGIILGAIIIMLSKSTDIKSPIKYFIAAAFGMSSVLIMWALLINLGSNSIVLNSILFGFSVMIMGVISVVVAVKSTTFIQRVIDKNILGKVLSIQELAYTAIVPIGLLIFNFLIGGFNIIENPKSIKNIFYVLGIVIPVIFFIILIISREISKRKSSRKKRETLNLFKKKDYIKIMLDEELSYYFKKMEELYLPDDNGDVHGILKMVINTGEVVEEWFLNLNGKECLANKTPCENYNTKLTLSKETFIKTFFGLESKEKSYNTGEVVVEGDLDFAAFLIICFPKSYVYDMWFFSLEQIVNQKKLKNKSIVYKFNIENSPEQISDDELSEPMILAADEDISTRFIIIKDNDCKVLRNNQTEINETVNIFFKDIELINFIKGSVTWDELINQSKVETNDLSKKLVEFNELFYIEQMALN